MKKTSFIFFIFVGLSFFLGRYLLHSDLFLFTHDHTHFARLYLLEKTLLSGQIPAIWADLTNHGFGYPLFHFYAPLFYYLALIIHWFSFSSLSLALNLTVIFSLILGSWGVFRLLKPFGYSLAFLGASAYLSLPYLALDIYVRGAYAELLALALLPWLVQVWFNFKATKKDFLFLVIITTLFLLSHNLIPYLVLPLVVTWALLLKPNFYRQYGLGLLLSFALGSFYFLPLIFELHFTQTLTRAAGTHFQDHFVYLHQLWNSVWNYGASVPGPNDGMSFKLGKLHLILAFLGLIGLIRKRYLSQKLWWAFFGILFFISLFFSLSFSQPFWYLIKPLQYLQFPWRFLGLASFALAILTAASLLLFPRRFRPILTLVFSLLLFGLNLKYFHPNPVSPYLSAKAQLQSNYIVDHLADEVPEYQPYWFHLPPANSFQFPHFQSYFNHLSLTLHLDHGQTIVLPKAYYPTWRLLVNHQSHDYKPNQYGLISFFLEPGDYTIELYQTHTSLEIVASFISLFTLLWLIVYVRKK